MTDRSPPAYAGYVEHPVGGKRCAGCSMFVPIGPLTPGRCTAVSGPISSNGYCRFWEPRVSKLRSFVELLKEEPSVGDVHVTTAIGNSKDRSRRHSRRRSRRRQQTPSAVMFLTPDVLQKRYASTADLPATVRERYSDRPKKLRQWLHVFNETWDARSDLGAADRERRAFASAWAAVQKLRSTDDVEKLVRKVVDATSVPPLEGLRNRRLEPFDDGTYHVPFPYSPVALGLMRPDQVPRFLDAVTHPDRLPLTRVPLGSLRVIKDRVSDDATQRHLKRLGDGKPLKPPVVVRLAGSNHVADGHDRLTAMWLNGDDDAEVSYENLDPFSEQKPDPSVEHQGSRYDLLQPPNGRRLTWNPNGTLAVPFTYDPGFLGSLRPDQVPQFLWALTHQDELPRAKISTDDVVAIQDRVNPDTVAAHVEDPSKKKPVIVRVNGRDYVADGHDRLASRWLLGKPTSKVRLADLGSTSSNQMRPANVRTAKSSDEWAIPMEVRKTDPDQRLIFGWASIVTKNGRLVVDHQGDVIPVEELEKAFYDYVLYARDQGHMHSRMGVGRLVECMVFTKLKQDLLNVVVKDEDGDQIEGAWVGYYVDDDDVWSAHKRGELPAFSIGGAAASTVMEVS